MHGLAGSVDGGDQPAEVAQTSGANSGMNFYYSRKLVGRERKELFETGVSKHRNHFLQFRNPAF